MKEEEIAKLNEDKAFAKYLTEFFSNMFKLHNLKGGDIERVTVLPDSDEFERLAAETELEGFVETFRYLVKNKPEVLERWIEGFKREIRELERKRAFASPTSAGYIAPIFDYGLQKDRDDPKREERFGDTLVTFFEYSKPQHGAAIQYRLFDSLLEERLKVIQTDLLQSLTPYGLKLLYLVLRQCDHNGRRPWFKFEDINELLDVLGHTRTKAGYHQAANRSRLKKTLEQLTRIKITAFGSTPKGPKGNKEIKKIRGWLMSFSELESWTETDVPGEKIDFREGISIFINPELYSYVYDGLYTVIPDAFLSIDAQRHGQAIQMYQYFCNQFRIGWHSCRGHMKWPLKQIIEEAGMKPKWPKRKDKKKAFLEKVEAELRYIHERKDLHTSIRIQKKNRPWDNWMITASALPDHPFRYGMRELLEEKLQKKGEKQG